MGLTRLPGTPAWFLCLRQNPDAPLRLFCFPYAGGDAWLFRTWPDLLPMAEVWGVQYPGRGVRFAEAAFTDLNELVEAIAGAMLPFLDRPFAFFGHSMGAIVSFEVARLLHRRGAPLPGKLMVSGRRAPQIPDRRPPLHRLPEDQFVEELRRFNGTPKVVLEHAELMSVLLPILRADFQAVETYVYQPGPPLPISLMAFGGEDDPLVLPQELDAWREHTATGFDLRLLAGDHFYLATQQQALLQMIAGELAVAPNMEPSTSRNTAW